jgi:hypothetical protein
MLRGNEPRGRHLHTRRSFSAIGALKAETQNCKQWAVSSPTQ